jgi:hypothetical protein
MQIVSLENWLYRGPSAGSSEQCASVVFGEVSLIGCVLWAVIINAILVLYGAPISLVVGSDFDQLAKCGLRWYEQSSSFSLSVLVPCTSRHPGKYSTV